jgi:hypothetical protein
VVLNLVERDVVVINVVLMPVGVMVQEEKKVIGVMKMLENIIMVLMEEFMMVKVKI